jgi:ATP-binding cassette subfamily C (CFTR/MRP) protein 4
VVGPVGVGKSSLLQCLLGELQPLKGAVSIEGKVSYASQDAWVFSATLRENILFGQPYKPAWYNSVIEACALDKVSYMFLIARNFQEIQVLRFSQIID